MSRCGPLTCETGVHLVVISALRTFTCMRRGCTVVQQGSRGGSVHVICPSTCHHAHFPERCIVVQDTLHTSPSDHHATQHLHHALPVDSGIFPPSGYPSQQVDIRTVGHIRAKKWDRACAVPRPVGTLKSYYRTRLLLEIVDQGATRAAMRA